MEEEKPADPSPEEQGPTENDAPADPVETKEDPPAEIVSQVPEDPPAVSIMLVSLFFRG
ncbi:hypothetical protein IMZ48_03680 [Candidatus Bathyarchaeota archaeon]|nr:hypothetical protein [Candidatus Bathyarchaeota archaeon]